MEMEAASGSLLVQFEGFFLGGGGGVVTGFKIVATIVAKSRGTLTPLQDKYQSSSKYTRKAV